MSDEIRVVVNYSIAAGAEIRIPVAELRDSGVRMEDYEAVERAVYAAARAQIADGTFDPMHDWTEYDRSDLQILDIDTGNCDLDWDDLTAEEQARVPAEDRP